MRRGGPTLGKRGGPIVWVGALSLFVAGCLASSPGVVAPGTARAAVDSPVAGLEIVYRFPNGRTYRARYAEQSVRFVLLEPKQATPPTAELPYTARTLRDDVFLVSWDGEPPYRATFVIDLAQRELHLSTWREGEGRLFSTGQIVEVVRPNGER